MPRVSPGLAGRRQAEGCLAVRYLRSEPYALISACMDLSEGYQATAILPATNPGGNYGRKLRSTTTRTRSTYGSTSSASSGAAGI